MTGRVVVGGLAPTPRPSPPSQVAGSDISIETRVHVGEDVLVGGFIPGTTQFTGRFGRFVRQERGNSIVTTKFWRDANFLER